MRYVLYDFDAGDLATTAVYTDYQEAATDADQFDNVVVLPLSVDARQVIVDLLDCSELNLDDLEDSTQAAIDSARAFLDDVVQAPLKTGGLAAGRFVIAAGNVFDGMTIHGTFPTGEEANEWADVTIDGDWWCVALQPVAPNQGRLTT